MTKFNQSIKSIALAENDMLAIGSCDTNKIEIWNVRNQSNILALNDHTDCVNALITFKHLDKTYLISGSADSEVRLYDADFTSIQTLKEHKGPVLALDYNPQLHLVASNSTDNKIKIWSFSYKLLVEMKQAHTKAIIRAICVLESGLIATGSEDRTIKIWKQINESSLQSVAHLKEHRDRVNALILLKNSSLVSSSDDKSIKVWNRIKKNTFGCVSTLNLKIEAFSLAVFESSLLISGHSDGSIQIRNQISFA